MTFTPDPTGHYTNAATHCPTCGRGPFYVVMQRIPAGAPFYFDSCPPPAAGVLLPAPTGATVSPVNGDTTPWKVGERVELTPAGQWKRINL